MAWYESESFILALKIVPSIIAFCSTVLTICACIKTGKWKGLFKKIGAVNTHTQKLVEFIEEAEQHKNWTGSEKLAYVVTKYHQYCLDNRLDFQEEEAINEIEELVDLTNKVNIRKENPKL